MKPDTTAILVGACCLLMVASALYIRNRIYSAPNPPAVSDEAEMGIDPYLGGSITIHYHERPPYYIEQDAGVGGIIGERISLIFEETGIPLAWRKTPPTRQLDAIRRNDHREGAAGWFKTPEREAVAKFSRPIYRDRPTIALARADQASIRSAAPLADVLADARLRLLRKDGYSYGNHIDRLLDRHRPPQIVTQADNLGMLRMIHSRRADYFFIPEEEAHFLLAHAGFPLDAFKVVTFADMPEGNLRFIMFSRRVEASTIDRLNRVIARIGID